MTTTYDLRSDTVTRPSPAMKRAMVEAPLGDDVLGDDPTVKRLEAMIAERTGKEAGLFFPSGTQANETAVNVHAPPGTEILVERRAHIYNYESGGPAVLSGVQVQPVETVHGIFDVTDLESRIRPRDPHCAQTRLLCIENTHNGHGGRIYPIEDMEEVSEWARGRGLAVHLDGARLFNAVVATGIPVRRYAASADTVSLCLSKGLGAPVGTCLVGDAETIDRARWVRKRLGGGMRQAGILAAAGIYALEQNVDRLALDHATARGIAEGLSEVEGLEVDLEGVQTNIVMIGITAQGISASSLVRALEEEGVGVLPVGPRRVRAVTHLDVPPGASEEVPGRFRRALAGLVGLDRPPEQVFQRVPPPA
ncbi:MAG TPA: low-specificity L-threonine aldolase [Gemmatimonadota bacterium]|nr:low-specificity L-threonine aldolase [Gemmatimonadota bacterium]